MDYMGIYIYKVLCIYSVIMCYIYIYIDSEIRKSRLNNKDFIQMDHMELFRIVRKMTLEPLVEAV